MASTAISAQGTSLKVDDSVPGTPDVSVANVISFSGFDGEASEIDVTNLSSTAKERIAGLQDFGSVNLEIHPDFTDPGQDLLRDAQSSGELKTFLITLPNGVELQWTGAVKNAQALNGGVDAALTGSVSLTVKGDLEITTP